MEEAKKYGGVGAILKIISGIFVLIPLIGIVLSPVMALVGLILVVLAVKKISEITKDEAIYKNYILFIVLIIIGYVIVVGVTAGSLGLAFFTSENPRELIKNLTGGAIAVLASFIVFWILAIIATLYLRKSFDGIAKHTKVGLFATTGLLYFIGAILVILFGLGGIIMLIAAILEIVSFFSLPAELPKEA